ncbi:MAG: histidine triad nucleotide-binding protein [Chlamydia sp. 32-24]|nr:MAG: histidine triad nucleotide-binding protein [Chlamydia sp. 32-24]
MSTVFSKIIKGELPADIVYESQNILAFKDIHPKAPIHLLIIPKKEIKNLQSVTKEDLPLVQEMIVAAQELAERFGICDGYRLLTNNGPLAGQEVFHLHFHLLGGEQLGSIA